MKTKTYNRFKDKNIAKYKILKFICLYTKRIKKYNKKF